MRRLAALATVALWISACSDGSTDPSVTSSTQPDTVVTSTSSGPTLSSAAPSVDEAVFEAVLGTSVDGFIEPVDLAVLGDTTYIVERGGMISFFESGKRGNAALEMTELTAAAGERGLLGLAFSDSHAFVNYTDIDGSTVIDRYAVADDGTFVESSRTTLLTIAQPYANHNGGDLVFDPATRSLLVFTGDGGAGGDPERRALDTASLLGKILRLRDVDSDGIAVPVTPEVAAVGLRNPWRAFLDDTTEMLYIADVGQDHWEEVDVVGIANLDGVSFGWSALEGTHGYNTDQAEANAAFTYVAPRHEYEHVDGRCSISGGAVYRGSTVNVAGSWYVYADFCSGDVIAIDVYDSPGDGVLKVGNVAQPVAVMPDADGELWVLSLTGTVTPLTQA